MRSWKVTCIFYQHLVNTQQINVVKPNEKALKKSMCLSEQCQNKSTPKPLTGHNSSSGS